MKLSFSELEDAYLMAGETGHTWLDRVTGEVLSWDDEVAGYVERGEDIRKLPDWQQEIARHAQRVMRALGELEDEANPDDDGPERYMEAPRRSSHDAFAAMRDFVETLQQPRLAEELSVVLNGRKPFRHFKDALLDYPQERERWFAFDNERVREEIAAWASDRDLQFAFNG